MFKKIIKILWKSAVIKYQQVPNFFSNFIFAIPKIPHPFPKALNSSKTLNLKSPVIFRLLKETPAAWWYFQSTMTIYFTINSIATIVKYCKRRRNKRERWKKKFLLSLIIILIVEVFFLLNSLQLKVVDYGQTLDRSGNLTHVCRESDHSGPLLVFILFQWVPVKIS